MSKKNQISFTQPSEPNFIRALKQKSGYQEGPTLSDKFKPQSDDDKSEDEVDPKQELLEMINNNQLSIAATSSCDLTKENLKDVLEGKDLTAIAAEREKEERELALKEAAKLPYDEKRDGKIIYRPQPPPPNSKVKRASDENQLHSENASNKKSKENPINKRLLTCISDEDSSNED